MADLPGTRASLLVRIRDPRDAGAWSQFVDLYAPLIYGFARKRGLQDADAADITQEVLRSVSTGIRGFEYDPGRGMFRGWLFTVVRNKLHDFAAAQARSEKAGGSDGRLKEQPGRETDFETIWEKEYEQQLFTWAADQAQKEVQPATWSAFWLTAIEGKSGKEVALVTGMSVAAVYLAKGRVLARLRDLVKEVRND